MFHSAANKIMLHMSSWQNSELADDSRFVPFVHLTTFFSQTKETKLDKTQAAFVQASLRNTSRRCGVLNGSCSGSLKWERRGEEVAEEEEAAPALLFSPPRGIFVFVPQLCRLQWQISAYKPHGGSSQSTHMFRSPFTAAECLWSEQALELNYCPALFLPHLLIS